jgi:anti-anti-sigma regulatory factor
MTSSRTDEGTANHCPVCGNDIQVERSAVPVRDASCPRCGYLLWFVDPTVTKFRFSNIVQARNFRYLYQWIDRVHEYNLLFDFGTVTFLSRISVSRLIALARHVTASGGCVVLCNVDRDILCNETQDVRDAFHLATLNRLLEIQP